MSTTVNGSEPKETGSGTRKRRGWAWTVTVLFAVLILIPSMLGFVMKFRELMYLSQGETDGGFAITPVVNYLFASLGFLCLIMWAAFNGMFNDLEKPKYLMLENEARLDAEEEKLHGSAH